MSFSKVLTDIKTLKIQGASSVAREAVKSIEFFLDKKTSKGQLLKDLYNAKKQLYESRPTEPCMRNALNYVFNFSEDLQLTELKHHIKERINYVLNYLRLSKEAIVDIGHKKIKRGMVVYTHCHSSTVVEVLKKAHFKGIKFKVHNTETRPLLQGRKTAKELASAGIPVEHFVDSGMRLALKHADLVLLGADAITTEGNVVNKIGSEIIALLAREFDIPVYICTYSWKFDALSVFGYDEVIEKRQAKEIWKNPPKGVNINNYAFETIDSNLIKGIITELGVFPPAVMVQIIRENYPWIFI